MKNKRIYLVRHGQSLDDDSIVFQSFDSGLSPLGKSQVKKIAKELGNVEIDCIISSPVQRAKESAEIIKNKINVDIEYSGLFIESYRPKSVDGKHRNDEKARATQKDWKKTLYTTDDSRVEGAENYNDVVARAKRALEYLEKRSESNIVVVTHGFFIRTMIAYAMFGDGLMPDILKTFQNYTQISNASVCAIDRVVYKDNPMWYLRTMNYNTHS